MTFDINQVSRIKVCFFLEELRNNETRPGGGSPITLQTVFRIWKLGKCEQREVAVIPMGV
jgi:hypothetical protein